MRSKEGMQEATQQSSNMPIQAAICRYKQQYADALKGYQDSVEEMKSPQRDEVGKRCE